MFGYRMDYLGGEVEVGFRAGARDTISVRCTVGVKIEVDSSLRF